MLECDLRLYKKDKVTGMYEMELCTTERNHKNKCPYWSPITKPKRYGILAWLRGIHRWHHYTNELNPQMYRANHVGGCEGYWFVNIPKPVKRSNKDVVCITCCYHSRICGCA